MGVDTEPTVLVTGATGTVGCHVAAALAEQGPRPFALSRVATRCLRVGFALEFVLCSLGFE